jgi:hypothetical protein
LRRGTVRRHRPNLGRPRRLGRESRRRTAVRHQQVATPRHIADQPVIGITERAPDVGDGLRQRPLADNHVRPDALHQLFLAHHLPDAPAENQQHVERLPAQSGELAVIREQLAGSQVEHAAAQRQPVGGQPFQRLALVHACPCWAPFRECHILARGLVRLCCDGSRRDSLVAFS